MTYHLDELSKKSVIYLFFQIKFESRNRLCRFKSVVTVINSSAAVTQSLLEQRPEKIQALSGIRTYDLCDASAVLSQLSYQSDMRAVVCGLAP